MHISYRHRISKTAFHLVFWVISYFILLRIFSFGGKSELVDHIYTLLYHLFLIPVVYINLYLLIPGLIRSGNRTLKWPVYIAACGLVIIIFSWLNIRFFNHWSAGILPDFYFISYYTIWEVALMLFIYVTLTTLIKLSRSWFVVNELKQQLLQAEKEKAGIELQALKSQINPHFFFNTLNGLYGMSLKSDENLPGSILRLSDLMRYFIYESREDRVALAREITILENYSELMKIRAGENAEIRILKTGDPENLFISPLLLISFLENAFKHGLKASTGKSYIRVGIDITDSQLNFRVVNNKGVVDPSVKDKEGGIGLENVKRRLSLIYPRKHELIIRETAEEYDVNLQIQLNE